jgi:2-polyprenyl-3-methyl-5-hydroxy-6-metoxy-1,4-benzoquinol methylase
MHSFSGVPRTEPVRCPLCGSSESRLFVTAGDRLHGTPGDYRYVRCVCGLVYQNPRIIEADIATLYPARDYEPYQAAGDTGPATGLKGRVRDVPLLGRFLRETIAVAGVGYRVAERLPSGARWLDVGCGNGEYLARLRARYAIEGVGVDFNPAAVAAARTLGLETYEGTVHTAPLAAGSFEVVSAWWVLEHVPDPRSDVRRIAELLRPGGVFLASVPNYRSVNARLFGRRWYQLDAPRHLTIWTPAVLARLLAEHGFTLERVAHDRAPWGLVRSLGRNTRIARAAAVPVTVAVGVARLADTFAVQARRH